VINSVGGNIGSVLGARLASGLHVGSIEVDYKDKKMRENLFTSIVIGLLTYFVLSIVIYLTLLFGNIKMNISLIEFILIFVIAGFLLICIVSFFSILAAFISFKRGLDPDDMVAPIVTTVGDVLGILILFLMISFFGVGV
jgi:mgtE-like transporter